MSRTYCGVLAVIRNDEGKYLLGKRHDPTNWSHGLWGFVGGGMEYGETAEVTLARECLEEIGCAVEILGDRPFVTTSQPHDDLQLVLLFYPVRLSAGAVPDISHDEETSEVGWFSPAEAAQLAVMPQSLEILTAADRHWKMYADRSV